ncbi:MAG: hypothetical protein HY954_10555, partial [Deltaproteobacteria bacterium]|nr:hypothetical protein [Deltaproteobacteria bacterium]
MKLPFRGLSNIQKFLISLSVIFLIAIIDYRSFTSKYKQVEAYDDLNYKISDVRVSITQLEYLLDMFTVSKRFENTSVELIRGDVDKLDHDISMIANNPRYKEVIRGNSLLSESVSSITNDWQTIKGEIRRLNDVLSQDELMLIHNSVDMNSVLIIERAERLISHIAETRRSVFEEIRTLVLKSIAGFMVLVLIASLVIHKKFIRPLNKAISVARRIASGDLRVRFREDEISSIGIFGSELNRMVEAVNESGDRKEKLKKELESEIKRKSLQIEALNIVLSFAGRSLAQNEVFKTAVKESKSAFGADGAAIYINEDSSLRLKASEGFDDNLVREGAYLPMSELNGTHKKDSVQVFKDVNEFPSARFRTLLISSGFRSLVSVPIAYNNGNMGLFLIGFKENGDLNGAPSFFEAVASGLGVSAGHANLFQSELGQRKFLERVVNQIPFGLAVFNKTGVCLLMNSSLKRFLGAEQRLSAPGDYCIFEDDIFYSQGMLTSIRKSYEGYATEFIINYN